MDIHTSFIIYHNKSMSEDDLLMTIASCVKQKHMESFEKIEVIVLLDGIKLRELHLLYNIIARRKDVIIAESNENLTYPGPMWNYGFSISRGANVCFLWTGVFWLEDSLYHLNKTITSGGFDAAYSKLKYEQISEECSYDISETGIFEPEESWQRSANILPLCYTLFTRNAALLLKGFNTDISMRRVIDLEYMLRANKICRIGMLKGSFITARQSFASIQYLENSLDKCIRCAIKGCNPSELRNTNKHISIAIISTMKETAQVQLCLCNYLEQLNDCHSISYRAFIEENVKPDELKEYDIVFFVRSRFENAITAAKYCYENNIKTVYIIDDNWFCVLETYPQLENQIGPNTIYFQNFLLLISTVDYVIVYNDILKNDIQKYNSNVILFPTNINLDHFKKTSEENNKKTINIGFAGSSARLPFFEPAFCALEKIMNKYENVNLFFKGFSLPSRFEKFGSRVNNTPYNFDYKKYAKEVSAWDYDIMISPLGNTKYINSKCPNKYLEITACGAAGIYSENEVYKQYIKNGENGLLISNDEESWLGALELLITDQTLRNKVISNATKEINEKFDTKVILPEFINLLEKITDKKVQYD